MEQADEYQRCLRMQRTVHAGPDRRPLRASGRSNHRHEAPTQKVLTECYAREHWMTSREIDRAPTVSSREDRVAEL